MWTWEKTSRIIEGQGGSQASIDQWSLVNSDGVRIDIIGVNRERAGTLCYSESGKSFSFYATRHSADGREQLCQFTVYGTPSLSHMFADGTSDESRRETLQRIKRNISDALPIIPQLSDGPNACPVSGFSFRDFDL